MPHDIKGRLIEVGDTIKVVPMDQKKPVIGTIIFVNESTTCSGHIMFPIPGKMVEKYFNAKDCELLLKANGDEPPAPLVIPTVAYA